MIYMEEKYTQGISIDGEYWNIPLVSIRRSFDVLDKYAERNEDNGDLKREILGVYLNYSMAFGIVDDPDLYQSLIDKLTEPEEFHDFELPNPKGTFKFRGYISKVADEYKKIHENTSTFHNLTCEFVMKRPFRIP